MDGRLREIYNPWRDRGGNWLVRGAEVPAWLWNSLMVRLLRFLKAGVALVFELALTFVMLRCI